MRTRWLIIYLLIGDEGMGGGGGGEGGGGGKVGKYTGKKNAH